MNEFAELLDYRQVPSLGSPSIDAFLRIGLTGPSTTEGQPCLIRAVELWAVCGYSETEAKEAIRFSLGAENSVGQIDRACGILDQVTTR